MIKFNQMFLILRTLKTEGYFLSRIKNTYLKQVFIYFIIIIIFLAMPHGMWIFPDQGSNLGPLHWERGDLATGHQGSPGFFVFVDAFRLVLQGAGDTCMSF